MPEYQIIRDLIAIILIPIIVHLWTRTLKNSDQIAELRNETTDKFGVLRTTLAANYVENRDFKKFEEKFDNFSSGVNSSIMEIKVAVGIREKTEKKHGKNK